jgi:hypothetical protein
MVISIRSNQKELLAKGMRLTTAKVSTANELNELLS